MVTLRRCTPTERRYPTFLNMVAFERLFDYEKEFLYVGGAESFDNK